QHQQHQHQPVVWPLVEDAVVVGDHGHQHRQGEVGVVHAALLAAPAVHRVHRHAGLHLRDHLALAGNDHHQHVGAHDGGDHGAGEHEGGAAGEELAGDPGGEHHVGAHQDAHHAVAVRAV